MALWQVNFLVLPIDMVGDADHVPEALIASVAGEDGDGMPGFTLPPNYAATLSGILPARKSWSSSLQIWGAEDSDDIQIWWNQGKVLSIEARIDVRKLDDLLLSRILALAEKWSCVLVEWKHRRVCRMNVAELRSLIAGHAHSRAVKDPSVWLPFLVEEAEKSR